MEQVDMEENDLHNIKKGISSLGLRFLLGTLAIYGIGYLFVLVIRGVRPEWLRDANISLIINSLAIYGCGMPIIALLLKNVPKNPPVKERMKAGSFTLAAIMCYSLGIIFNIIGLIITFVIGLVKGSGVSNPVINTVTSTNPIVLIICAVIIAPIIEEYVFRKLIIDRTIQYGQGVAILIAGLLFGLFHGNLNQFVFAFPFGLFMAFLYVKTGKIQITIGIHMIINFMGSVIPTMFLRAIHYEEYMALFNSGASAEQVNAYIVQYLPAWLCYMGYILLIFALVVTGFVLLIVFHKRFRLDKEKSVIPKGKKFQTVFCNIGMVAFCLFWMGVIIYKLMI